MLLQVHCCCEPTVAENARARNSTNDHRVLGGFQLVLNINVTTAVGIQAHLQRLLKRLVIHHLRVYVVPVRTPTEKGEEAGGFNVIVNDVCGGGKGRSVSVH